MWPQGITLEDESRVATLADAPSQNVYEGEIMLAIKNNSIYHIETGSKVIDTSGKSAAVPVGAIIGFVETDAVDSSSNWKLCDGTSGSFVVEGTSFSTNVPNLTSDIFLCGTNESAGTSPNT